MTTTPPLTPVAVTSWSYSHFMYLLRQPFEGEWSDCTKLVDMPEPDLEQLIVRLLARCDELENKMLSENLSLRQNKIYTRSTDVSYSYPENYDFIGACRQFIKTYGIIVFDHLDKFEVIRSFLLRGSQVLAKSFDPFTRDTIWHLNPFITEFAEADVRNMYNFRGESPDDRHAMSLLFNLPQIGSCPLDVHNLWDESSFIYADKSCDIPPRDPLSLSKFIKKSK